MKITLLFIAVVSVAILASCDPAPPVPPEAPFPIGVWQTTREYFGITVEDANPEEFKDMREREASDAVTADGSYKLEFREGGTGSGSGLHPDGSGRYDFNFTWQLSDGRLTISGNDAVFYDIRLLWDNIEWSEIDAVGDIVFEEGVRAENQVVWNVDESSAEAMVLSTSWHNEMTVSEWWYFIRETHTYRYTFEKVK